MRAGADYRSEWQEAQRVLCEFHGGYHRPEPRFADGGCAWCVLRVGGWVHTYMSAQGRSYCSVPPSLGTEKERGRKVRREEGDEELHLAASSSLPSHPCPVERVSTSFSGSGWCSLWGCSRAVVGASSLVELIRCKLGSSLGHKMKLDASSPVHPSQAKGQAMPIQVRTRTVPHIWTRDLN